MREPGEGARRGSGLGAGGSLRLARAFLRRDLLEALTYKANVAMRVVAGLAFLYMAHFTARAFAGHEPPAVAACGGYFPFLFMGMLVTDAGWALMTGPSARVRQAQLAGTLEVVVSRIGAARLVALESLGALAWALLRSALYVAGAAMLLGFEARATATAALAVALTIAALLPIGVIGAGLTMVARRADPVGRGVHGLSMLLAGVVYPTTVLPGWLQLAGEALPPTHALRALRAAFLGCEAPASLLPLAAFALGGAVVAALALRVTDRLARRAGSLGHY